MPVFLGCTHRGALASSIHKLEAHHKKRGWAYYGLVSSVSSSGCLGLQRGTVPTSLPFLRQHARPAGLALVLLLPSSAGPTPSDMADDLVEVWVKVRRPGRPVCDCRQTQPARLRFVARVLGPPACAVPLVPPQPDILHGRDALPASRVLEWAWTCCPLSGEQIGKADFW